MPGLRSKDAPHFSSDSINKLDDFLFEFEKLAKTHKVTGSDCVHTALRYTDHKSKQLWRTADGYDTDVSKCDWDKFKKELTTNFYALRKRKYTLCELQDITRKWRRRGFRSKADLNKYHRQFTPVSGALKKKSVITNTEVKHTFWKGFNRCLQQRLEDHICQIDATWTRETPPDISKVLAAGCWVLRSTIYDTNSDDEFDSSSNNEPIHKQRSRKAKSKAKKAARPDSDESDSDAAPAPAVQTKKVAGPTVNDLQAALEKLSLAQATAFQQMLQPLVQSLSQSSMGSTYATTYQFKNPALQHNDGHNHFPQSNNMQDGCYFCAGPHFVAECL